MFTSKQSWRPTPRPRASQRHTAHQILQRLKNELPACTYSDSTLRRFVGRRKHVTATSRMVVIGGLASNTMRSKPISRAKPNKSLNRDAC